MCTRFLTALVLTLVPFAAGLLQAGETLSEPGTISFSRDVVPALTKAGCNSGACHGSFQGRGGFRLSLLGFDPQADHDALVHEARGRRVFPASPEHSLLLMKPTGAVPHGGGRRLDRDSAAYRILRAWIVQGLAGPDAQEVPIARLEVSPGEAVSAPGKQLALRVRAVWSDGRARDVTPWALYESNKDQVATVSAAGVIRVLGPGRASVMVRYLGCVAAVPVTVPFPRAGKMPSWPRYNFIDDHITAAWRQAGLDPAPLCSDVEFVRRVYLDLIGTLPTPDEVRRFLASRAADRREKLIDELLERPEYVDYWALKWGDLLRAHRRALGEKGLQSFNGWLRQALRENRPFDRVVRQLLTARGSLYQNGAAAFFFIDQAPQDLAETTSQVFLGVRLQCAKCHHHPFEVWGQDDYYGLAAFFARVRRKDNKEDGLFGGSQSVSVAPAGEVRSPASGKLALPQVLGGPPLTVPEGEDPRERLADWVTAKDNPFFARNIVNRYWGYLFGRGLVEPVDDLRATNPPSHPALLDALARDFAENGYDLKRLLRTLCGSRAYQLASEVAPQRDADGTFFTHRRPRRLSAEVLLDAINQVAGTAEEFGNLPAGTRAIALPDPAVASPFLDTFGRPKRTSNCECERGGGADLGQVLHLVNSDRIHGKVTASRGRVARLLAAKKSDAEVVEELYLAALSRPPSAAERETVLKLLAVSPSRKEGFEDLLWTLLNMAEFSCSH